MVTTYGVDALNITGSTLCLNPNYDGSKDRIYIEINNDNIYLDGNLNVDAPGAEINQTAMVTHMDGALIASGVSYVDMFYDLMLPDGSFVTIDVIKIDGVVVGYGAETPLVEGVMYDRVDAAGVGTADQIGASALKTEHLQEVSWFGPGTHLMTTDGEVPVEWLATGDRLITRDHGAQKVLWIGRSKVSVEDMVGNPEMVPCAIDAGALGANCPTHDTTLSPQHHVLLAGYQVELHTGTGEAFAVAKHLVDGAAMRRAEVMGEITYTHVLLAQHEVILANGLWVESLFLGQPLETPLGAILPRQVLHNLALQKGHATTARLCLKGWEVAALMGKRRSACLTTLIRRAA